jgi:hypothetical protein
MEIALRNVRISYPHLFEPFSYQGQGKAKFSAKFLISKTEQADQVKALADAIKALCASEARDKKVPPADKLCLRDGDQSGKEEEVGYWVLSASDDRRPVVVDQKRNPLTAEDDVIYAGCYVNARIRLWYMDNQYGKRVPANLLGVQFVKDGERLGSGRVRQSADEMFDSVEGFDDGGDAGNDPFA